MKKRLLFVHLYLLTTGLPAFGQDKITNVRTAEYVDIPGTKFAIIPPDTSFKVTTFETLGLVSENQKCTIHVSDGPFFYDFDEARAQRIEEARNGELEMIKDLEINGCRALLYKMKIPPPKTGENKFWEGDDNMIFLTLIGSKERVLWSLTATYLSGVDDEIGAQLEQSFRSVIFDPERVVNPFDGQTFELKTELNPFIYAWQSPSQGVRFNLYGRRPTPEERKDFFVAILTKQAMPVELQKDHVTNRALNFHSNGTLSEIKEIELAGLEGYEAIGYGKDQDNQIVMRYAVGLFEKGQYFELLCYAQSDFNERIVQFRAIAESFNLKK